MPTYSLLQILSVGATAAVIVAAPTYTVWFSIAVCLTLSHYVIALAYSHQQIKTIVAQPASYLPAALVLAGGAYLYHIHFSLAVYFAFHHAFNEVYLRTRQLAPALRFNTPAYRASLVVYHLLAFSLILQVQDLFARPTLLALLLLGTLGCFSFCMATLYRHRRGTSLGTLLHMSIFEGVVLALVIAAFFYRFDLLQAVFYHVLLWAIYPVKNLVSRKRIKALIVYLALTAGSLAGFLLISPLGPPDYRLPTRDLYEYFLIGAYIHITLSFALSRSHPEWINYWFRPRKLRRAATTG